MKRSTNEKTAIILAVSVILSVTACSADGVAYVDGNRSEPGFSSSAAATSGTIYEESTLPATVSITTATTTKKQKNNRCFDNRCLNSCHTAKTAAINGSSFLQALMRDLSKAAGTE